MTKVTPTRIARNLSAGAVAGIAAWSSYLHMVHVALSFGERPEIAYAVPFSVDGMLVVASMAMVDDKASGRKVRRSARLAFVVGVAASVAANVAAAAPTAGARIVAGWPALALLLVVEILSRSGRKIEKPEMLATSAEQMSTVDPHPVAAVTALTLPAAPVSPAPAGAGRERLGAFGLPRMPVLGRPDAPVPAV
jgi:Protein of unknown function (DUF2637)